MSAPSPLRSAVVLLVQPERDDRDMYALFLRHAGMTPVIVSDAAPALVLATDSHVIVTELLLPGSMDGIEFIMRLRRDRATNGIPIIVLTSSAWDTERERAERAGCDMFLPKPCLPDRLLHQIRRLLAKSATWTRPRQQAYANLPIEPKTRRHPKRTG
jgi:two-component system cell cycle response regulator DivK